MQEIKATPDKISKATSNFVAEKVDEAERKLDDTVESIKAAPKKISKASSDFITQKVEETERSIERAVDEVTAAPRKVVDQVSLVFIFKSSL